MQAELTEYYVVTQCGRTFGWSDTDFDSLIRSLHFSGYTPVYIKPMSEYEAEVMAREEQERLMDEFRRQFDEDVRKSA
ncbi:hypothetical protein [Paenibacillus sp. DMB20]|uniref:hypothetical protein n=1 Tax=Paenibacillus sp. DMB20 TaxID=1642570 RepID=UPI00062815F5|nr:hypothetical protein [Paenibacillus sp. DMB20]KKO51110.1 hypothetical protein XI25_29425 [Paenibacillus sp. DMB20]